MTYRHRLIEVDLPIRRTSNYGWREKFIRRGNISTTKPLRFPEAGSQSRLTTWTSATILRTVWGQCLRSNSFANTGLDFMLIRAYGQFWNPDIVDWGKQGPGNQGQLIGNGKWGSTTVTIDSWKQHGIYVLHDEFKCVYVGQTSGQF